MKKYLFFEMPKTGSTFISSIVAKELGKKIEINGHIQLYKNGQRNIPGYKKEDLFRFCFVREPLSRFISAYRYLMVPRKISERDMRERKAIKKFNNFDEFCKNLEKFTQNHEDFPIHFYPQHLWIFDENNVCSMDYVGKYEEMNLSWKYITNRLGINYRPISGLNKKGFIGKYIHFRKKLYDLLYRKKLSGENIKNICEFYKKDYSAFNYSNYKSVT